MLITSGDLLEEPLFRLQLTDVSRWGCTDDHVVIEFDNGEHAAFGTPCGSAICDALDAAATTVVALTLSPVAAPLKSSPAFGSAVVAVLDDVVAHTARSEAPSPAGSADSCSIGEPSPVMRQVAWSSTPSSPAGSPGSRV